MSLTNNNQEVLLYTKFKSYVDLEFEKLDLQSAKVLSIFGITLVPASLVLDYFINPDYLGTFFFIRLGMTIGFMLVFSVSFLKISTKHGGLLSKITILIAGGGIALMVRVLGYDNPYYAGLNLIYLATMLVPWGFSETLFTCLGVYSFYIVPIVLFNMSNLSIPIFINNNVFQIETIAMASIMNYFQYRRRRREILNMLTIADQAKEVESKSSELEQSYAHLKKTEAAKKEFIANIAHDLKSPLSVILGHSELLETDVEPGTNLWKYSRFIGKSTMQLTRLIDRLVSTAILDDKEEKLNLELFEYTLAVKEFFKLFQENALKKNITYSLDIKSDACVVEVDTTWLERVFGNLVQNAFKFTGANGSISISVYNDDRCVYTEVSDTGIGIPADKLGRIFDRKYQAHEASREQGYGLGLSIVKDILARFGGDISVSSYEGKGTTFKFNLPLFPDQQARVVNAPYEGAERRALGRREKERRALERRVRTDRRGVERARVIKDTITREIEVDSFTLNLDEYENKNPKKPTILIVEDTPGQINLVIAGLKDDYNLVFAQNGVHGLEKLAAYKAKIALILSDVKMPEMDGLEFCGNVMKKKEYKKIPFIFLTAYTNQEEELKGLRMGATDYIQKPINTYVLREKIGNWIKKK